MMDFKQEVEQHFKEAISRYQMRVVPFDQSEVLLVGQDFSLSVSHDRESVEICYIEPTTRGAFAFYRITNMLGMHRFLPNDRKLFGNPSNTEEQVRASLRVISSGLTNRCADILSGNREWLNDLRKKDPASWKGQPLDAMLSAVLLPVLSRRS